MTTHRSLQACTLVLLAACALLTQAVSGFAALVLPTLAEQDQFPITGPFAPNRIGIIVNANPPNSYALIRLRDVPPGYSIINDGLYFGWCLDSHLDIDFSYYPGTYIYDSYDFAGLGAAGFDTTNFDKVNYILNHKPSGATATDIQLAIWHFIGGGGVYEQYLRFTPDLIDPPFPFPNLPLIDSIILDADTNGVGFVPAAGQIRGVVIDLPASLNGGVHLQPFLIELISPPEVATKRIGDFVWKDLNANGVQNVGEPGINGVLVTLKDNNNVTLATTVTGPHPTIIGQNGYYQFTDLLAGTYKVVVDNNSPALAGCTPTIVSAPGSTTANDSNPNPATVILLPETLEDQTIDFGYVPPLPGFKVLKTVNKTTIAPGDSVTYTYTVKNTGNTTLTNIEVIDDNATPDFLGDDFIVVTGLTLAPGAQQSFTLTKIPPVTLFGYINNAYAPVGTLIVQQLPNLDWRVFYRQSLNVVDNTYGTNASGWPSGHTFADLTGSDKVRVQFTNGAGAIVLDFYGDYLSASNTYPSGYGTLGPFGGDGSMVSGSSANIVSGTTTLTTNLNQSAAFYGYKTNSPAPPANFPTWDYVVGYTVVVKNSTFGASGFKKVTVPFVHNSPAKIGGTNLTPVPCNSTATNTAKGTAKSGTTTLMDQASATVNIICPPPPVTYTATQGGWGAPPSGNNVGMLLKNNFTRVYPGGSVTIGGKYTAKFTSSNAIDVFLPAGGTPNKLTSSYTNPTTTTAGVLAGQVLALRLNVDFSNAGITPAGLGTMKLVTTKLAGYTVAQALTLANQVLGSGTAPPSGISISDINDAITTINQNFDNGTNQGNLIP